MTIASNLSFLQNSAGAITTGTVNAIGSPITFSVNNTEYNRIDTNGYSLLGYTTSQGAYKLQVNGNVLINGTLSLTTASIGNITGSVTTASNIAGGTTGQLVYQTGVGLTGFAGPGSYGQFLMSTGASAPVYQSTLTQANGNIVITSQTASTSTNTGALQIVNGGVGIGGSLNVGSTITVYSTLTTMLNSGTGGGNGVPGGLVGSQGLIWNSATGVQPMNAYLQVAGYTNNVNPPVSKLSFLVGVNGAASEQMYVTSQGLFYIAGGGIHAGSTLNDSTNSLRIQNNAAATSGGAGAQPSNKLILQGTSWNSAQGSNATNGSIQAITLVNNANPTTEGIAFAPGSGVSGVTATNYFVMTNQARFGIGTLAPVGQFDVVNTATSQLLFSVSNTGTVNINTTTGVNSANSGALQVAGGVGIAGGLYVGGTITATNFVGNISGSAGATSGALTAGTGLTSSGGTFNGSTNITFTLNTATLMASSVAIAGGTTGQLHYQSAANTTGFVGPGTANQILVSAGASAPVYTNTGSIQVGYAANILAGTTGQLIYQSAANTTGFVGPGTAGQFLQSAGASAPTYVSTGTMYVQRAVLADSVTGSAGSLANALTIGTGLSGTSYNGSSAVTIANTGVLTITGSANQVLVNGGTASANGNVTLTLSTATMLSNMVVNLVGGTTGQLHYQSAANTTGFVGPGTAGQFLQSAGAGAPTYVSTGTMYVQRAVQADSASGSAGSSAQVQTQAQPASASYYPTFVSANNGSATAMSVYTSSSVYVNPASGTLTASIFQATNNGGGTNFQVGDDAWIGDINIADTMSIRGQQSPANGYIIFGNADTTAKLGRAGSGALTYSGNVVVHGGNTSTTYVQRAVLADSATGSAGSTGNINATANTNVFEYIVGVSASGSSSAAATVGTTVPVGFNASTGFVGIGNSSPGAKLHVSASADGDSIFKISGSGGTNATVKFADVDIGGQGYGGAYLAWGRGGSYDNWFMVYTRTSGNVSTERLRITANGGVSFGSGGTNYGTSGQILQSNGDGPPTWINQSSLSAGTATDSTKLPLAGGTMTGNILFGDSGTTKRGIEGTVGANDYWFVGGGATASNSGWMEIATGDDAQTAGTAEPIMVSQYGPGDPLTGTLVSRAFLATKSNNTTFPNNFGIGFNKTTAPYSETEPSAKFHVVVATPSGIGSLPSGTSAIIDNTGNNFLTFRNSSDNGTYSGIAMQDNNVGGFVIFGNAGGGGDQIYVAGYSGGSLQYGVTDSIAPRTTILAWTSAGTAVTGAGTFTGEVTAYYSDRRLKENVKPIGNAVEKISKLNGIVYNPNELAESFGFDKTQEIVGLFADEVEAVLPQAVKPAPFDQTTEGVSKSGENYKTVQYEKLVPLLVEAIKEQQQTINDQNTRIEKLEQLIKNLTNKYSE